MHFKILTRLHPPNRDPVFLKCFSQILTMSKPFEPTATCQLLYLYVRSMKESQVCVSIYQPFTQKGILLKRYEKLSPKKKLIFSCKAHSTLSYKCIMEKTSCLRTAVTSLSLFLFGPTQQVVAISLVMAASPMPQLVWGTGLMLPKCFASEQCPKPHESPTATFGRWQKRILLIDTSVFDLRVHPDKEWGGAVASAATDMNCHCPSVWWCLSDFCQEPELSF